MHSYLRAIGFSEYKTKSDIIELTNKVAENPDHQTALVSSAPETYVEMTHSFGKGIGITWNGTTYDGAPEYDYYFPFCEGEHTYLRQGFSVEKRIGNNSYTGVIEDLRSGVAVIFYIINALDYIEWSENKFINYEKTPIALSGLSISGTILLPISMSEEELKRRRAELRHRTRLIAAARKGDERAMENLTLDDMDAYSKISKRIVKEDVFSIVTSSFMPYGLECDQYSIIGEILNVDKTENIITKEMIWLLMLDYNGIIIDIAINSMDLVGEPVVGRRFKGNIWLQGKIER